VTTRELVVRIAAMWPALAPHEVARLPFRYYFALRSELLIRLKQEAAAYRPPSEDDGGDVDRRFGL
jgi:hypothetical protein